MKRPVDTVVGDRRLQIDPASVERCVGVLEAQQVWRVPPGSLDIAFVDEAACRSLHTDFFDDPELTDVMTFPGDPEDAHAGDIAICPAVAARSAPEHRLPFAEELTLYLVHGWLHLAGLKDQEADDRSAMRRAEAGLMEVLRVHEALLDARWQEAEGAAQSDYDGLR